MDLRDAISYEQVVQNNAVGSVKLTEDLALYAFFVYIYISQY